MLLSASKNFIAVAALVFFSCSKSSVVADSGFKTPPVSMLLDPMIAESSGITYSKTNPGCLWIEEDSGNPPIVYLLRGNGKIFHMSYLENITNRDWEDIAIDGNEIYIGDTGDNSLAYPDYEFYWFTEPIALVDTITNVNTIHFKYPDGSHDAEAFLIDPATKDIYIITKRDNPSKLYRLTYPYGLSMNTASFTEDLPYAGVTSAALSPDGKEIIIKTYTDLYYYTRKNNESLAVTLKRSFSKIPYLPEPQGEAISFAGDNSGFYTLSEKGFSSSVNLYFYPRK